MNKEKTLSAGGSALFLTVLSTISQILAFGYRVILSRLVGAEVMGLYQLVMPVYSVLMSLTAIGLTAAVSNLTSQYLAWNNSRGVAQVINTCLKVFFLLMLPLAVLVFLYSDPISVYLLGDARTQLGMILLVPCVALTGVENLHKHYYYGSGLVRTPAVVELMEQFVRTAAVLGLLIAFLPQYPERVVGLIVAGMVICEVFSSITLCVLVRSRWHRRGLQGAGEKGPVRRRRVASIAVPVAATSLLGNLMGAANATLIPRKLVEGGMTRSAAMSEFGVVCGMTLPMLGLPIVFLGAMRLIMVPKLAQSTALGRWDEVRRRINRAMSAVSVLTLPSMAMMVVLGPDLGRLLFKQDGVGEFLFPLAIAMTISCYEAILSSALNGVGKQGESALISILCSALQLAIVLTTVALPNVGMKGYVVAVLVSSALELLLTIWRVVRHTEIKLRIFDWVTAPGLGALLAALTTNLLFQYLKNSDIGVLPAGLGSLLFAVVIYLSALHAQGVSVRKLFRIR